MSRRGVLPQRIPASPTGSDYVYDGKGEVADESNRSKRFDICTHPGPWRRSSLFVSTCRGRSSSVSSALLARWASSRFLEVSVSWATPAPSLTSGTLVDAVLRGCTSVVNGWRRMLKPTATGALAVPSVPVQRSECVVPWD
jgi:hypothetical protein